MTNMGILPTAGEEAMVNPPLPLLVNTVSVLFPLFAEIKSTLPSPLTSAAVTELGTVPAPRIGEEATTNPPLPLLVSIVRESSYSFAQTKSILPSPLTSAAVTAEGKLPTVGEEAVANPP